MGWLCNGGVFFQLVTIRLLFTLVLSKRVDTLFIFDVLDPNYIWISLKAILLLCQSLFAWSFSRFWVLKFLKAHVYNLCLLKVLSTSVFQSSYLLVFELLSSSVSQSSYLHVSVSKFLSTNCVFQSSSLFASKLLSTSVCVKIYVY
jgi:hypothetical protein